MDYIAIGEDELEKAKYAMITGKVFIHNGNMIRGNEIKKIERDVRFYTGWYDTYEPKDGADTLQMERDMPDPMLFLEREKQGDARVAFIMQRNKPELLSDVQAIDQLLLA